MRKWILILIISTVSSAVSAKNLTHSYSNYSADFKAKQTKKTFVLNGNSYTVHYSCTTYVSDTKSISQPQILESLNIFGTDKNKSDFIDLINNWCGY